MMMLMMMHGKYPIILSINFSKANLLIIQQIIFLWKSLHASRGRTRSSSLSQSPYPLYILGLFYHFDRYAGSTWLNILLEQSYERMMGPSNTIKCPTQRQRHSTWHQAIGGRITACCMTSSSTKRDGDVRGAVLRSTG